MISFAKPAAPFADHALASQIESWLQCEAAVEIAAALKSIEQRASNWTRTVAL